MTNPKSINFNFDIPGEFELLSGPQVTFDSFQFIVGLEAPDLAPLRSNGTFDFGF